MADAKVFQGRDASLATERISILAQGQVALFFEFFENDYHVYGTRRPSPHDVLTTAFQVYGAIDPNAPPLATYRLLTAAETIQVEKPIKLHELKAVIATHTEDISYMDVTMRVGHLWADINAGKTAHFGFATPFRIYDRPLSFLQQLTPVTLEDEDLKDISDFLRDHTSERYRVQ